MSLKNSELILRTNRKLASILGDELPILEKVNRFVVESGGKRIRPLMHYYFATMLGYRGKEWLDVGAIGELIHAASLLHDDVIDEGQMRRGKPTINALHGNKTAILGGDYLLACGIDHLRKLEHSAQLLPLFTTVIRQLAIGELIQMEWEGRFNIDLATYDKILHGKTASLFGAMTASAAVLAGLAGDEREHYHQFGLTLGRIFQLRDDYLDYYGSDETVGKERFQDFTRGLVTRPLILLRDLSTGREQSDLAHHWQSEAGRKGAGVALFLELAERYRLKERLEEELGADFTALQLSLDRHGDSKERHTIEEQLQKLRVGSSFTA